MGKRIEIVWVELFASPDSANAFYSWSAADAEGTPSRGGGFRAHAAFPGLKVFRPAATRYRAVPEAAARRPLVDAAAKVRSCWLCISIFSWFLLNYVICLHI